MEIPWFNRKGNIKKKMMYQFSSEKFLGMTVLVSLFLHVGAIYTIPAVNLFSEGSGDPDAEMIIVDFIAEEVSEEPLDVLQSEENQFLASQPVAPQPTTPPPIEEELMPAEEPDFPTPPPVQDLVEPESGYALLAQTIEREPEFTLERKHLTPRPEPFVQQQMPDIPKRDKLPVKREFVPPDIQERPERSELQKPVMVPRQVPAERNTPIPEKQLQFPKGSKPLVTRPVITPLDESESRLGFTSKRPAKILAQEPPPPSSRDSLGIHGSKRRLVGLDKKTLHDTNQFGIFAGAYIELPQMKETVQEAGLTREPPETPVTERTERARTLELTAQIEGPLKGRAIVHKPSLPQVGDIENEMELRLKFWVLPDGTIGEVIPLKRGDTHLERIAIAYLKQWQFEPLASNAPQQKIWGTIPIVFTAQ